MKKIYILLSRTGTVPSRVIHWFKGGDFTHTSISLEPRTDRFFSYARRKLNNTLIAGFIVEDIHKGVFSFYPNCKCRVYELEISDEAYKSIQNQIAYYMEFYEKAKYNFFGLFTAIFGVSTKNALRHTCSQFVATILDESGAVKLPKKAAAMLPNDFMEIENIKLVYDGILTDCVIIPSETHIQLN